MAAKSAVLRAVLAATLAGCGGGASPSPPTTSAPSRLAPVAFMSGNWEGASDKESFDEHWTAPRGDVMLGVGRELDAQGKLLFWEFMRLEARPDGLYLIPQPHGKPPHDFKLVTSEGARAVFESPGGDRIKRITYARGPGDTLDARVEGETPDGKKIDDRYHYTRTRTR